MSQKLGIVALAAAVAAIAAFGETVHADLADDGKIGLFEIPGLIKRGFDVVPVLKQGPQILAELKDLDPVETAELVNELSEHLPDADDAHRQALVERVKRALPHIVGAVQELVGHGLQVEPAESAAPQSYETDPTA